MIDIVLGASHHLGGRDTHITSGTFRTITSVRPEHWQRHKGKIFITKANRNKEFTPYTLRVLAGRTGGVREIYLLEEVLLTEELPVPGKALVVQLRMTLAALQALGMPGPLQHLQYKAIQDQFVAATTLRYRCYTKREGGTKKKNRSKLIAILLDTI